MSPFVNHGGRLRAYLLFLAAIFYYFLVRSLALHGAMDLVNELWLPYAEQLILVFLLLLGFGAMGFWFDGQSRPIAEQGLVRREGWLGELGLGLATGWSLALLCVLGMTLAGGIAFTFSFQGSAWGWLIADLIYFALVALAEELVFRGYAFQHFLNAVGPTGATLGFAAIYTMLQALVPGTSRVSVVVSLAFSFLLTTAFLRTRALWVSWGLNFGWKASRALLFGLAVSGVSSHSPVVQGDPMGPFWLTGAAFGLDASWLAFMVLAVAIPVLYGLTRELEERYNAPVFVPGGIAVDLDAIARAQHEAATAPASPTLVQILPVQTKDEGTGTRD
jgi:hypothetical protein